MQLDSEKAVMTHSTLHPIRSRPLCPVRVVLFLVTALLLGFVTPASLYAQSDDSPTRQEVVGLLDAANAQTEAGDTADALETLAAAALAAAELDEAELVARVHDEIGDIHRGAQDHADAAQAYELAAAAWQEADDVRAALTAYARAAASHVESDSLDEAIAVYDSAIEFAWLVMMKLPPHRSRSVRGIYWSSSKTTR